VRSAFFRRVRPEQVREIALFVIIIIIVLFFATQVPSFISGRTFTRVATLVPITIVLGVGLTMVILTRNIDLSIGSQVAVVAYGVGTLLITDPGLNPAFVIALCILLGIIMGAINGLIVAYGGVPAIVATLGTLALYRSILSTTSTAEPVTVALLPDWIVDINSVNLATIEGFQVRVLPLVTLAIVIVFQLIISYVRFGRRLFAIGSNPDAARNAGLPIKRDVFTTFVICGALAGLAGWMWIARFGNVNTQAAVGLELVVVAAVVVGGVNIFGGSGSMIGVVLGAMLIVILEQGLIRWAEVSEFLREALLGLLILLAVASDKIILDRLRAIWARQRRQLDEHEHAGPAATGGVVDG
jgi:rhamnose transport system permease protein